MKKKLTIFFVIFNFSIGHKKNFILRILILNFCLFQLVDHFQNKKCCGINFTERRYYEDHRLMLDHMKVCEIVLNFIRFGMESYFEIEYILLIRLIDL